MVTLEVCVDTPAGLLACFEGGADRVELCGALALGGLTPSPGLMAVAADMTVPIHAMIRPVAGNFILTDQICDVMMADIAEARRFGLAGVVLGATTEDLQLDTANLAKLVAAAGPMAVTLHRAIDLCADPLDSIDKAAELGISRILTSGGAPSADQGTATIAAMVRHANGRLVVMAGAGIRPETVGQIVRKTGVQGIHASCATDASESEQISGFGFGPATRRVTDPDKIKAMRCALRGV